MSNRILDEIKAERVRQDLKWGGSVHDDQHSMNDWITFITAYATKEYDCCEQHIAGDLFVFRDNAVKVAALAVAAIEWVDRKEGEK